MTPTTYKDAGVNQVVGDEIKDSIKELARKTHSEQVLSGLGLFSGFYSFQSKNYKNPVLVASIDGVGTKVKIAQMMGIYHTIGEDLVNHCVNDIMVCGADPLFFLDYIASDSLDQTIVKEIVRGISYACSKSNCALIGGETAEMPQVYMAKNFDIAGSIVGVVEKEAIIDGSKIAANDVLIGIASNGLHTNGYSFVRKLFFENNKHSVSDYFDEIQSTLGEELLKTHRNYQILFQKVRSIDGLRGIAHVTGGGIIGNTSRLLRNKLKVQIDWSAWEKPPIFNLIQVIGNVSDSEMQRVFNLGIGLVLVVKREATERFIQICGTSGENAYAMGSIIQ